MREVTIKAQAKINLTLDVLRKRSDGFHEVEMIMQTIELHDIVSIIEAKEGITVTTDHPLLGDTKSNIAYTMANILRNEYKINKGVRIHINKKIPVAAGLAGGSTDAAAVLKGLNILWNLGLTNKELEQKGALVGSDVPFCIRGGTALAKGRGEILSALPDIPKLWLVLAKPPIEVLTSEIYRNFKPEAVKARPQVNNAIKAIEDGNSASIVKNMVNVLESVTLVRYPIVHKLKTAMEEAGVSKALMSGSGPSVFGVVGNLEMAQVVAANIKRRMPDTFIEVSSTCPAF